MNFNFGNLVSAAVGAVSKVANAVVNALSPVAKGGGLFGGIADAVIGAAIAVASICEDGEIDEDEIEEILANVVKVYVGATIAMFGSGSLRVESDYEEAERLREESNINEYNKIVANGEELENLQKQSDEMIKQRTDIEKDNLKNGVEWEHQDMDDYIYGDEDSAAKVKVRGNAANAKAEAKFSVYDDGKINPEARIGAEAKYSGIKVEGEAEAGDKNLGIGIEGKGGLINGGAEAALKIGENEVNGKWNACVKGKAIATVAEGSVEGKFKICGLEIDLEGTGYAGGIGAEFQGGIDSGKFKLKAGAAALLGGGASVSIGLAD